MRRLIDTACSACGHVQVDVWVTSSEPIALCCHLCGGKVERAWAFVKAPGVSPNGIPADVGFDAPTFERVDTKAIAAETKAEIEQKWLRYSDEKIAEQHVSREINEKAGLADAAGNIKPVVMPEPITFPKPIPALAA